MTNTQNKENVSIEELLKEVNNLVLICKPVMDSYAGDTRQADFQLVIQKVNTFKKQKT